MSAVYKTYGYPEKRVLGYRPTCSCSAEAAPPLVIDPFAGGGTTGVVALARGMRFLGIDLSHAYVALCQARLVAPLTEEARGYAAREAAGQLGLFDGEARGRSA